MLCEGDCAGVRWTVLYSPCEDETLSVSCEGVC